MGQIQRVPITGAAAAAAAAPTTEVIEEEPLYVNAKQYHRILKRRQARAKLENDGRIPKERRVSGVTQLSRNFQKNFNSLDFPLSGYSYPTLQRLFKKKILKKNSDKKNPSLETGEWSYTALGSCLKTGQHLFFVIIYLLLPIKSLKCIIFYSVSKILAI